MTMLADSPMTTTSPAPIEPNRPTLRSLDVFYCATHGGVTFAPDGPCSHADAPVDDYGYEPCRLTRCYAYV